MSGDAPRSADTVTRLNAGSSHTCGLNSDDSAVCWGDNSVGQASPPGNERFVSLANKSLGDYTCGLCADGSALCWGYNNHGQTSPPTGNRYVSVSAVGRHSCGLQTDGLVVCWGDNKYGQSNSKGLR